MNAVDQSVTHTHIGIHKQTSVRCVMACIRHSHLKPNPFWCYCVIKSPSHCYPMYSIFCCCCCSSMWLCSCINCCRFAPILQSNNDLEEMSVRLRFKWHWGTTKRNSKKKHKLVSVLVIRYSVGKVTIRFNVNSKLILNNFLFRLQSPEICIESQAQHAHTSTVNVV